MAIGIGSGVGLGVWAMSSPVGQSFPAYWDFVNGSYRLNGRANTLSGSTTYTRSGTAYSDNVGGSWTSFSTDTHRITDKGLLVESSSTNHVRNNSMQGAATGTPGTLPTNWSLTLNGGLTRTITAIDTFNGMDRIRIQIQGTATDTNNIVFSFEGATAITAATGQTWTQSAYLALSNITGVFYGQFNTVERTAAGGFVTQGSDPYSWITSPTINTPTRYAYTYTTSGGGTVARIQPRLVIGVNSGSTVDFIVDVCWPQMEQRASASSPIRTTSAAVTRNTDTPVLVAPWHAFDLTYTFSDNTTESEVQKMANHTIPTTLSKPYIKRIDATRTDPTKCFFIVGDSIGNGDGGTEATKWFRQLIAAYSPARVFYNTSSAGQNSTTMATNGIADVAHKDWTWIVSDGRPNTGESANTVIQNYKNLISDVTSFGGKVFIAPVLPMSTGGGTDPLATAVSGINSTLLTDPVLSGRTMGSSAQSTYLGLMVNDSNRSGDFIHVNDAGQTVMATHFKTALDALSY